ncbi:hypothetical protein SUGI_0377300 [Cryptomeria japonica]|nr:hypothetical protein SUGI_0377300 [Cryptomeria japonica]
MLKTAVRRTRAPSAPVPGTRAPHAPVLVFCSEIWCEVRSLSASSGSVTCGVVRIPKPALISEKSREEAANILDAASNPGDPPWRSSTQSIATDDQALALHFDVNFSGAPLSANWQALSLISKILANRIDLSREDVGKGCAIWLYNYRQELARYPALTTEIFLVQDLETEYIYCDPCLVQFWYLDPLFENLFKA